MNTYKRGNSLPKKRRKKDLKKYYKLVGKNKYIREGCFYGDFGQYV